MSPVHVARMEGFNPESLDDMSIVLSKPLGYLFLELRKRYTSLKTIGHQQIMNNSVMAEGPEVFLGAGQKQ